MEQQFTHLHVHTEYSMLDGAARISPLVEAAVELGMPAIGMTDHGNMHGAYEMHAAATKAGIKPIIGIEAYVAPGSRLHKQPVRWGQDRPRNPSGENPDVSGGGSYLHMTMLAENATGLRNLFKLSSIASLEGFYRKPRMDRDIISRHASGIIATTGCLSGEVQTRIRLGQYDEALKAAAEWQDIFGKNNFFLEVMDHGIAAEREVLEGLGRIGKTLGMPPLATNDSHYVHKSDAKTHDLLLCIGVGKTRDDPDRFRFNGTGYHLKPPAEMRALWDETIPGACDNTLLIAERVQSYDEVFLEQQPMPRFPVPDGHTPSTWLREQTRVGVQARFGDTPGQDVLDRVGYELGVIEQMGFESYFLIVADICKHARENGIAVGPGRGSATGSMVAYVTRITELDPIEHGLLFERFLNPDRVSMPDVDLDFDDTRRGEMIQYVTDKYGEDRCAQIVTFGTLKAKAAVKDAARVLGFPYALGERITKAFPPAVGGNEIPLSAIFDPDHDRYKDAQPLRDLYGSDGDAVEIIDAARGLEGLTRGTGVHPAGVIISDGPLVDILPVTRREEDGAVIAGFPFTQAEAMGLLKMDFLGLRTLTVLTATVTGVRQRIGTEINLGTLPLDDAKTYELLARGDTLGVFQLDSTAMRSLLRMIVPTRFDDIAAALALYRPGPMAANAHTNYALRKNGKQPTTPIHAELGEPLEQILGPTFHLVVYQEQVMAIAQKVAGYTLAGADLLRRAMGKKKKAELDKQYETFAAGMASNGFGTEAMRALWDVLVPFSGYGFNKSHAAGYALLSYWTAYLKANYPSDFMAALLTSIGDNKERSALYLSECRRMDVKVLPPDVNESGLRYAAVDDRAVRFGLGAIRNVGENAVPAIVGPRVDGPYSSFGEWLSRIGLAACNKRVVDSLIKAGAFDSMGHPRFGLQLIHEQAVDAAVEQKKSEAFGQDSLFGDAPENLTPAVPDAEWDQKTLLAFEREMLGMYVSDHPLNGNDPVLARHRSATIAEILVSGKDGATARICGLITSVDKRISKKNNPWGVVTVEDLDASIQVTFFGKSYLLVSSSLVQDTIVSISGKIQSKDESRSVLGDGLAVVNLASTAPPPVLIDVDGRRFTTALARDLKEVLRLHSGKTPVQMRVRSGSGRVTLVALPEYPVTPGPEFAGDIKVLLGLDALLSEA